MLSGKVSMVAVAEMQLTVSVSSFPAPSPAAAWHGRHRNGERGGVQNNEKELHGARIRGRMLDILSTALFSTLTILASERGVREA